MDEKKLFSSVRRKNLMIFQSNDNQILSTPFLKEDSNFFFPSLFGKSLRAYQGWPFGASLSLIIIIIIIFWPNRKLLPLFKRKTILIDLVFFIFFFLFYTTTRIFDTTDAGRKLPGSKNILDSTICRTRKPCINKSVYYTWFFFLFHLSFLSISNIYRRVCEIPQFKLWRIHDLQSRANTR